MSPTPQRHTKIVATLGPALDAPGRLADAFEAGVSVVRLNFSHGSVADHRRRLAAVREIEQQTGRVIGVLGDIQGPKFRLGRFAEDKIAVSPGQRLTLDLDETPGSDARVCLPHPSIFASVQAGDQLLVDDGKVRLQVLEAGADRMVVEVVVGTGLSSNKGVNLPNTTLNESVLTPKDRQDIAAAVEMGCDWLALSFVQSARDVLEARSLVGDACALVAKIEKPQAVTDIDAILEAADGLMIARGDLGVEVPPEEVPAIQKRLVSLARAKAKPVIVATQMLESMISAPIPTRAEASDVATAVYDGTDAVMLSAESAVGDYPLEAIRMMDRILRQTEQEAIYRQMITSSRPALSKRGSDNLMRAAVNVAEALNAPSLVSYSTHGSTALRAARERPDLPIICLTAQLSTARRLALSYGIEPMVSADAGSVEDMVQFARDAAIALNHAQTGDRIVVTAGMPFGRPGNTNLLHIALL